MTTITFFVSFFVLLLISALRAYQLKVGEINFLTNFYVRSDSFLNNILDSIIYSYNRWRKISNIFVFEFLPSLLYENLVKAKDYVSKKYYENGDRYRGRRVLRSHGSVSFFLGRLSEERGTTNEGGI